MYIYIYIGHICHADSNYRNCIPILYFICISNVYIGNKLVILNVQRYFTTQLLYRYNLPVCNYTDILLYLKLK